MDIKDRSEFVWGRGILLCRIENYCHLVLAMKDSIIIEFRPEFPASPKSRDQVSANLPEGKTIDFIAQSIGTDSHLDYGYNSSLDWLLISMIEDSF